MVRRTQSPENQVWRRGSRPWCFDPRNGRIPIRGGLVRPFGNALFLGVFCAFEPL